MIKNYLRIAWRQLLKNKLYASVNLLGLTIGIASCILIGLYVWNELSYDRFHSKGDRIVRATWEYRFQSEVQSTVYTGTKVGPEFKRNFPQVEEYVRVMMYQTVVRAGDKMFSEKKFLYADAPFFSVFSFPLIKGDAKTALDAPDKIVLSKSMAKKYFGDEDPVGKSLKIGAKKEFLVTGIAAEAPDNSQIGFDFVASFSSLGASKTEKYSEANYITYLLLQSKDQVPFMQTKGKEQMSALVKKEMELTGGNYSAYNLEPLTSVHLHSKLDGLKPNGSMFYIYVLSAIALLILLIACVNYTNLSTAQSAGRSTEIGIRKVLGAGKKQVFMQFMSESFLLTLIAVILGVLVSAMLLSYFNSVAGKQLSMTMLADPRAIMALALLAVLVTFTSGAYPALVLSGGRIIGILKSGLRLTGSNALRRTLIIFQFVISVFLIISTVIILQQLDYIRNKDIGYNKEQVMVIPIDYTMMEKYDDLRNAIAAQPGVVSVGGAYEEPTDIGWGDALGKGAEYNEKNRISINALPVDENFLRTLNVKFVAGTDYTQADVLKIDTSNDGANLRYSFMLNESAARALGWTPEQAVGQIVSKNVPGEVKAVVKDFHFHSFHETITPLVIFLDKRMVTRFFVKLSGNIPASIASLEKVWKDRVNHRPFDYHFLDEDFDALYQSEARTAKVFTSFSTLAILLACLGLFALTAYSMVQRTKEIGIRKVLGATVPNILTLVSKDFLKLVLIALLIAAPASWWAIHKWLEGFAYRTEVAWWVFALAGLAVLLIAFITISLQAIKTAMANPIKNLRTE